MSGHIKNILLKVLFAFSLSFGYVYSDTFLEQNCDFSGLSNTTALENVCQFDDSPKKTTYSSFQKQFFKLFYKGQNTDYKHYKFNLLNFNFEQNIIYKIHQKLVFVKQVRVSIRNNLNSQIETEKYS